MQWTGGPGVGFTSGTPWESPQPDAAAANVAAQDTARGSLLNLYRRLIHLRAGNDALAAGRLTQLTTGNPKVVAYLRGTGGHAVLVIANLGDAPVSGLAVTSAAGLLRPGAYTARSLLEGQAGRALQVAAGGRVRGYTPARTLGPRSVLVLDLVRR